MLKINKKTSIDLYCDDLGSERNVMLCEYLERNFDVRYRKHVEKDCIYYRIKVTGSEKRKLKRFLKCFDKYWFDLLVIGNYIELSY